MYKFRAKEYSGWERSYTVDGIGEEARVSCTVYDSAGYYRADYSYTNKPMLRRTIQLIIDDLTYYGAKFNRDMRQLVV